MRNKRHLFLCLICLLLFAVASPSIRVSAQEQEAALQLTPGSTYYRFVPEGFGIGPIFIDTGQPQTLIYKDLPPGLTEADVTEYNIATQTLLNQFVFEDAGGAEFSVTLHFSNLLAGDNPLSKNKVIPFEQVSMVTLADHSSGLDSFNPATPPADTVGVDAPVDCPGWTNNLQTDCPELTTNYFITNDPVVHASDPQTDITKETTFFNVNPAQSYGLYEIIEFAGGEKALVTAIATDNTAINVRRGILGTTVSEQTAGSGITGYGPSSRPVTIMQAIPFPDRIGSYSIGFGFLLKIISASFEQGDYSGSITIDINVNG